MLYLNKNKQYAYEVTKSLNLYKLLYLNKREKEPKRERAIIEPIQIVVFKSYDETSFYDVNGDIEPIQIVVFKFFGFCFFSSLGLLLNLYKLLYLNFCWNI